MPRIKIDGISIHYEIHGEGFPLILIRGFGSNADHWYCQVPAFSKRFRTVVFDNRGIGRSDKPGGLYSIADMSEDTVGLMDALNIECAHVLGISMGGMIAQEVALRNPSRVNGLVLACTHCGGSHTIRSRKETAEIFSRFASTGSPEDGTKMAGCLFTQKTIRERPEIVSRYREVSSRFPVEPDVLSRQLQAIYGHETWKRLHEIKNPTLIITGGDDVLIPPENSRTLAERISGAKLEVISGCGHQLILEEDEVFNNRVIEFLTAVSL